jgi:hypothetical protein
MKKVFFLLTNLLTNFLQKSAVPDKNKVTDKILRMQQVFIKYYFVFVFSLLLLITTKNCRFCRSVVRQIMLPGVDEKKYIYNMEYVVGVSSSFTNGKVKEGAIPDRKLFVVEVLKHFFKYSSNLICFLCVWSQWRKFYENFEQSNFSQFLKWILFIRKIESPSKFSSMTDVTSLEAILLLKIICFDIIVWVLVKCKM